MAAGAIKRHSEHHGKKVLMCLQLDILLSVWEDEFTCSFLSIKKKKTRYKWTCPWPHLPRLLKILSVFVPHGCDVFVLELGRMMCNFRHQKQKDYIKHFSLRYFVYEMKTAFIKGHREWKMLDFNSLNKTLASVSWLPVLLLSFLWETTTPSHTGYGFGLLTDNRCGTQGALLLWLLVHYMVNLQIHQSSVSFITQKTSGLKCSTALPLLVYINKMRTMK